MRQLSQQEFPGRKRDKLAGVPVYGKNFERRSLEGLKTAAAIALPTAGLTSPGNVGSQGPRRMCGAGCGIECRDRAGAADTLVRATQAARRSRIFWLRHNSPLGNCAKSEGLVDLWPV